MNLTITVDGETLKRARIRALEENTSVNAVLSEYLQAYAGLTLRRQQALADLLGLSRQTASCRGECRWTRDELHER